jgi:hypothetical protein
MTLKQKGPTNNGARKCIMSPFPSKVDMPLLRRSNLDVSLHRLLHCTVMQKPHQQRWL